MRHKHRLRSLRWIARNLCLNADNVQAKQKCVLQPNDVAGRQNLYAWVQQALSIRLRLKPVDTNGLTLDYRNSCPHVSHSNVVSTANAVRPPFHRHDPECWRLAPARTAVNPSYPPTIAVCVLSNVCGRRNLERPLFRRLDTLAVHDDDTGFWLASGFHTHLLAQPLQYLLPHAASAQFTKVVVHRFVRWEVVRQRFPNTAIARHIQNRVQQLATTMFFLRAACIAPLRQQPCQLLPLCIAQITGIGFSFFHPSSLSRNFVFNSYALSN